MRFLSPYDKYPKKVKRIYVCKLGEVTKDEIFFILPFSLLVMMINMKLNHNDTFQLVCVLILSSIHLHPTYLHVTHNINLY